MYFTRRRARRRGGAGGRFVSGTDLVFKEVENEAKGEAMVGGRKDVCRPNVAARRR